MLRRNNAQSIVEYAILLGVVIAALLVMQLFVKRGYQGGLKDASDKIGEQFSASATTMKQTRTMKTGDKQTIKEGTATNTKFNTFFGSTSVGSSTALDKNVYSYSERSGGEITANTDSRTASLKQETGKVPERTVTDYSIK